MKFKKIYVEITNNCNLNCDFCPKNNRDKTFLQKNDFTYLLKHLKGYSDYLYFHVMGEPLLHPSINEFIDIAAKEYKINITTNGYLIKRIENNKNIRQINISLHSYDEKYNKSLEEYLTTIISTCDKLNNSETIVNYRLWTKSRYQQQIINFLNDYYKVDIKLQKGYKIKENIFIEEDTEFNWPDLNNNICNKSGSCYGLKTHIGILVDGTIVPCCLDCNGLINLGNIYKQNLEEIINLPRSQKILKGFSENKRIEKLCKHCDFIKK